MVLVLHNDMLVSLLDPFLYLASSLSITSAAPKQWLKQILNNVVGGYPVGAFLWGDLDQDH